MWLRKRSQEECKEAHWSLKSGVRLSNDPPPARPITIWVDCARIGGGYCLSGGCSFTDENGLAQLGSRRPGYIPGVRSKVVQALAHQRPQLYEQLVKAAVLPPVACHDAHHCTT